MKKLWFAFGLIMLFIVSCAPSMKDFPKLQAKAASPDESTRLSAVKDIGRIKGATPEVLPVVISTLKNDTSDNVRAEAARSLKNLGFDQAAEPLKEALKSDRSPDVRIASAEALYGIVGQNAYDPLVTALKDDDSTVRTNCVKFIGNIGGPAACDVIRERLVKDKAGDVRGQAAASLGELKDEKSVPELKKAALNDSEIEVKKAAVIAIGVFPGNDALNFLCSALKKQELQDAAITALDNNQKGSDSREVITTLLAISRSSSNLDPRVLNIFLRSPDPRVKPFFYSAIIDDNVDRDAIDVIVKRLKMENDYSMVPRLINDLQGTRDLDKTVRLCQALGDFGDPRATSPIMSLLQASLYNRKQQSLLIPHYINALGNIGDLKAWDYLCRLHCQDSEEKVRYDSGQALYRMYYNNIQDTHPASPCECK